MKLLVALTDIFGTIRDGQSPGLEQLFQLLNQSEDCVEPIGIFRHSVSLSKLPQATH
jgi:hypothetical protein